MTALLHGNGASVTGPAATPGEVLAHPDGNYLAICRVPAANHDCEQARVGVFLDETHRYISTPAARSLSLALARRESCASEGVAVWRRPVRDAYEDPSGVWLVLRREDGQEVGLRLLGSYVDAVARMFSRVEAPTDEEVAESRRREQAALQAALQVMEEQERAARERRQAEARMLEEYRRREREAWRATYGDLPMPPDGYDDAQGLDWAEDTTGDTLRVVIPRFGIAARGRPILVCGLPGSLKSWLLHDLGVAVARHERAVWGGIPIEIEGEFLLLEYENPPATTHDRVDRFCRARGLRDRHDMHAHRIIAPSTLLIDSDAEERLTCDCWGVAVCAIDSLQTACGEQKEMLDFVLERLRRVTMRTGTTFFVIVHCVKHPGRVRDLLARLEFISGRTCDSALWLERTTGKDTVRIQVAKASHVPEDSLRPATVRLVGGVGEPVRFELVESAKPKVSAVPSRLTAAENKIRSRVFRALAEQSHNYSTLRKAVTGKNETILKVLGDLVAAGEVVPDPETGRYTLAPGLSPAVCPRDGTRGQLAVPTTDREDNCPRLSPAVPGTTGPLAPAPLKGAGQGHGDHLHGDSDDMQHGPGSR